jgi:hypothetical protein
VAEVGNVSEVLQNTQNQQEQLIKQVEAEEAKLASEIKDSDNIEEARKFVQEQQRLKAEAKAAEKNTTVAQQSVETSDKLAREVVRQSSGSPDKGSTWLATLQIKEQKAKEI